MSRRTRPRDQQMAWARRQRGVHLSALQSDALDSVFPSWRHSHDGIWCARLDAVEAFFKDTGHYPSQRASDPEERTIGMWLKNNRLGGVQSSPERRAIIDLRLPGWNPSADEVWAARLDEAVSLVAGLGRMPRSSGSPAERRVRRWLETQAASAGAGSDSRRQTLDDRLSGWRGTG